MFQDWRYDLAVRIRMKKMGSKKRPFYRFVVADSRSPRDGRFIETLGYYNPMTDPPEIKLDDDKVYKWLNDGAIPSENARELLRKAGLLERWSLLKRGVKIQELDAKIEEMRAKQPAAISREEREARKAAKKSKEKLVEEKTKEAEPVEKSAEQNETPEAEAQVKEAEPEKTEEAAGGAEEEKKGE